MNYKTDHESRQESNFEDYLGDSVTIWYLRVTTPVDDPKR